MDSKGNHAQPTPRVLPFVFTFAYAIIFVQALIYWFDREGMTGVFIASGCAYTPLGLIAGAAWRPSLLPLSVVAATPVWVFLLVLYDWSIVAIVTGMVGRVPLVLEPLSVSLFYFVGAWAGKKLAGAFKQRKLFAGHV